MNKLNDEINKYRKVIRTQSLNISFGEIINMYKDDEITISSEYKRAFRWNEQIQTDFIESILIGFPFPSIFVAENPDGRWDLIDGLQRISTVLSFFGELKNEKKEDLPKNNLILKKGRLVESIEGLTIKTLPLECKLLIKRTLCHVEIFSKNSKLRICHELLRDFFRSKEV